MGEKVKIRRAKVEDGAELLRIYAPYVEKTAVSFEYAVPTEEEFQRRIAAIMGRYPYLVAEQRGKLLGYAYAAAFKKRAAYDWAVETTIYLDMDMKRRGIGRLLYEALERALRAQGVLNMNACIAAPKEEDEYLNNDSPKFHERMGFQLVGRFHDCGYKFGRWYDMIWMEKQLGAHVGKQPPVIPFTEIAIEL